MASRCSSFDGDRPAYQAPVLRDGRWRPPHRARGATKGYAAAPTVFGGPPALRNVARMLSLRDRGRGFRFALDVNCLNEIQEGAVDLVGVGP